MAKKAKEVNEFVVFNVLGAPWRLFKVEDLVKEESVVGFCSGYHRIIAIDGNTLNHFGDEWASTFFHEFTHAVLDSGIDATEKNATETIAELMGIALMGVYLEIPRIKKEFSEAKSWTSSELEEKEGLDVETKKGVKIEKL